MESESLVITGWSEKNCSGKRVNLFGSIDWIGDSIHQSLNITGKPIAKKYCEGKLKRTLKKEWKELERVLCERKIREKGVGSVRDEGVRWWGSMMANRSWCRDFGRGRLCEQEMGFIVRLPVCWVWGVILGSWGALELWTGIFGRAGRRGRSCDKREGTAGLLRKWIFYPSWNTDQGV